MKQTKFILVAIIVSVSLFNIGCSDEPDIKLDKTLSTPPLYAQLGHIPDQIKYWQSTNKEMNLFEDEDTLMYTSKKFPEQSKSYVFNDGKCVFIMMRDVWDSQKKAMYMIEGAMDVIKDMGFINILERAGDGDTEIKMTYGHRVVPDLQCKLYLDMRRLPKTTMLLTFYRVNEEN